MVVAVIAATVATFAQPQLQVPAEKALADQGEMRNFDARVGLQGLHVFAARDAQQAAVEELRTLMPDLLVDYEMATGATRSLWNMGGYLTPPDGRDPEAIAQDYMVSQAMLLGLADADIVDAELTDRVPSDITGVTHLYYRQRLNGIPVYNAQLHVNITKDGRILSVNNQFLPNLTMAVPSLRPAMSAATAVQYAGAHLGVTGFAPIVEGEARGIQQVTDLSAPQLSTEPIKAQLMLVPIQRGEARLVWNFQIYTLDDNHAFDMTVDAETGQIWTRFDWVASDNYRVYARPVESPNHTTPVPPADGRVLAANPHDTTASPFGWHDTNGVAGAEFTTTQGNNVHAYTDTNNDNAPDPGSSPNCGAGLNCDFALNLANAPSTYQPAAVTNLFYWNNIIHDIQYRYGFNEVAGNFQVNNYGRGGTANDDVRAEAQDGGGTNNANFLTPPDGQRPRMQMYLWNHSTPQRDGDLDAGIIVHEYGHGISNRQVGAPSNVSCLGNAQQPGEGISDWLALVYTARSTDTAAQGRGVGTYALNQPTTGVGIRAQRYSTDPAVNTWTYQSITGAAIPHGVGAVWAQGMWEVYWALVNQYGFSANLHNATGGFGNQRAMLYHNEGLKFTSCSPGFTQIRDGILQAAQTINGGADVCRMWEAFAGFGLGVNAVNPSTGSTSGIVNGFNVPVACGGPATPSFTINDVTQAEGNAGLTNFNFTVTRANAGASASTVQWTTADGTALGRTHTPSNNTPITMGTSAGPAAPYPSTINVAGVGTVRSVGVRLNNVSHTWPDDLDIVLVGPGGQRVMLMSDAGGSNTLTNVTLEFRDGAPALPDSAAISPGIYRPTDYQPGETMPAPAPAGPYGTSLSVFNGTNANGNWTLYVADDAAADAGSIGGWTLLLSGEAADYIPAAGELTFAPGVTTQTVTVQVVGDTTVEPNETFAVNLLNPSNATISDAQGVGTIVNDDGGGGGAVPTSANDAYVTPHNTTLTVPAPGVLGNDNTNGGGAMTAQLVSAPPPGGTFALNPNGGFTFTPNPGFIGTPSFTYRAVNTVGQGNVATVWITVQAPAAPPQPPTNLRVDRVSGNTVTLRWTPPASGPAPTQYVVEGGTGPGTVMASMPTGHAGPLYTFNAPNGSFFVRVHSVVGATRSAASNEVPLFVNVPVAPSAPTGLLGLVQGNNVALRWRNTFGGGAPTNVVVDVTGTLSTSVTLGASEAFDFTGVPNGSYTFRVRGVNAGGAGPFSNTVTLSFPTACSGAPQTPVNLTAFRVGGTAYVLWDPVASGPAATSYVLTVTGAYNGTFPTTARMVSSGIGPGTYNLSVRSVNVCGQSAATPVVQLVVP